MEKEELRDCMEADIMQADRESLVDIGDIRIEEGKEPEERWEEYAGQAKNPYLVKAGDYVLKLRYTENGKSMEERLLEYAAGIAQPHFPAYGNGRGRQG